MLKVRLKTIFNRTVSHSPRGGGAMRNYIYKALRLIFLVGMILIVFAEKVK